MNKVVKSLSHGMSEVLLMALQKEATWLRESSLLQCRTPSISDRFIILHHLVEETILSLAPFFTIIVIFM